MKPGTPQFVGGRLREVREVRGITAVDLADQIGVSPQAVSQYERGGQTPSPDVLRRIGEVLEVPTHFLLRPVRSEESAVLFFRSLSSATKRDRVRAARKYEWLRDVVGYIHGFVEFPGVRFPELHIPEDPRQLRDEDIEEAARTLRKTWGLGDGPISNVVWLAENNGVLVARQSLNSEALDAFSQWNASDQRPYIVVGTDKASAVRARFNLAHELAHVLLHRNVPTSMFNTAAIFRLLEDQANRFASAFLLPAVTFAQSVYSVTLDGFRAIKEQWGVSIAAMIMRSSQMRLVNESQTQRLFMNRSRRGWNTTEPLDDVLPAEEPRFLRRAFDLLLEQGLVSRDQIELQLARRASDIEAVVGLPRGYLARELNGVRLKMDSASISRPEPAQHREDLVFPFPPMRNRI
ncbi:MAG: transcriptional regulator [Planctomycetota bacterium]|nr:MAG: transcriptional regulator [Planctomycetota bacterium]